MGGVADILAPMSIVLRPARPEECAALTELVMRSKAHWGYDAGFLARCRRVLTVDPALIARHPNRVAEIDGAPAGFAAFESIGGGVDVLLLFVDPPAMGRGVGRALFAWIEAAAADSGASVIRIEADPGAERFYLRMGAERVGEARSEVDPNRLLPALRKRVGGPLSAG